MTKIVSTIELMQIFCFQLRVNSDEFRVIADEAWTQIVEVRDMPAYERARRQAYGEARAQSRTYGEARQSPYNVGGSGGGDSAYGGGEPRASKPTSYVDQLPKSYALPDTYSKPDTSLTCGKQLKRLFCSAFCRDVCFFNVKTRRFAFEFM